MAPRQVAGTVTTQLPPGQFAVGGGEPKWFPRDWSRLADDGARAETLVACHLLKAVEGWTDLGFGEFELRYLRDRNLCDQAEKAEAHMS